MHRRRAWQPEAPGASPLRSPAAVFPGLRILTSKRAATASRSEPDARNGLSLARNGCPFQSLHSGVTGPGLLLRLLARRLRSPFRLPLRYRPRFAPVAAASSLLARGRFLDWCGRLRLPPPLPFGTSPSLRIKAFCRICRPPARLANPPDLPSLPAAVSLSLVSTGRGSPFQDRYVSAGLLFLKPLGTLLNMRPPSHSVNDFCA